MDEWQELQIWRQISASMHPYRKEILILNRYDPLMQAWQNAKDRVQSIRQRMRYVRTIPRGETVASTVSKHLNDLHKRTTFTVRCGKQPDAKEGTFRSVAITIGYMYQKKVWDKFYREQVSRPETNWFLLSADQYRLNQKHIELYECLAYNTKSKELRTVYATIATIGGKRMTFVNHTMQSVVKNAHDYVENIVTKTLQGEAA